MQIIAGAKDPLTGKQPQAASEAELRLSLRQAIEARDVADAAARDAKEVADKPDHLARRPPMKRRKLKAVLAEANDRALQSHLCRRRSAQGWPSAAGKYSRTG